MDPNERQSSRRDFLVLSANVFPAVGGTVALWPFIAQMNPDANTLALANLEVDLAPIKPGQAITVLWRGKPVFVRRRTPEEIQAARAVPLDTLKDRLARNPGVAEAAPALDENRVKAGHEEWLVLVGVCTHLGCVPQGQRSMEKRGDFGGWYCSCHGSQYDTSGRIRLGPAPANLDVPPYYFMSASKIMIGPLAPLPPSA